MDGWCFSRIWATIEQVMTVKTNKSQPAQLPQESLVDGSPLSSTEGNKNTLRAYDRLAVIVRSA